jgi:hypothetical protein
VEGRRIARPPEKEEPRKRHRVLAATFTVTGDITTNAVNSPGVTMDNDGDNGTNGVNAGALDDYHGGDGGTGQTPGTIFDTVDVQTFDITTNERASEGVLALARGGDGGQGGNDEGVTPKGGVGGTGGNGGNYTITVTGGSGASIVTNNTSTDAVDGATPVPSYGVFASVNGGDGGNGGTAKGVVSSGGKGG